jgi:hypothetical protein
MLDIARIIAVGLRQRFRLETNDNKEIMMKKEKYVLSKREVINAIATEPVLEDGQFLRLEDGKFVKECPVCAVGAVLRRAEPRFDNDVFNAYNALNDSFCAIDYSTKTDEEFEKLSILDKISSAFEYAVEEADNSLLVSHEEAIELGRLHAINVAEAFGPEKIVIKF